MISKGMLSPFQVLFQIGLIDFWVVEKIRLHKTHPLIADILLF